MKRLLFILSCILLLSSCYSPSMGRLEKLEGNQATVRLYSNGGSEVSTIVLKDTLDLFLKTPLEAKGQDIMVYNGNALSLVDYTVVEKILKPFKWIGIGFISLMFLIAFLKTIVSNMTQKRKIETIGVYLGLTTITILGMIFLSTMPSKIMDYGKILQFDGHYCTIETDAGEKKTYWVSSTVFPVNKQDSRILNPSSEGMIYKSNGTYRLYQSFDKSRDIVEVTMHYINEENMFYQIVCLCIIISIWICLILVWYRVTHPKVETTDRQKVEAARKKQEELKQQEYRSSCEELVTKFWEDYLDSPEETSVLLARLEVTLQNSGYQNWKKEFYDIIAKRARESNRPPKEQRQKASSQVKDEEFGNIRINFNGLFITPEQYRILSKNSKARSMNPDELIILCRKLAERMPEFRDFLEGKIIRTPQSLIDNNEAYALFGLTFETLTEDKLKQAYRHLVQIYHPDKNPNAKAKEMFQKVQRYHAYLEAELHRKAA